MSLDALTNRGEYLSAHYLADVLPGSLRTGVLKQWADEERHDKETPRTRMRALRRAYNKLKSELAEQEPRSAVHMETLRALHREILTALGFAEATTPEQLTVERAGQEHIIPVVHAEPGIVVIESGWAADADAATDPDDAGRLLDPVTIDPTKPMDTAAALASYLLLSEDQPPRYVLILSGAVVILADRLTWFEGRYLAVSLDVAYGRNDTSTGGELDVITTLFCAESLRPPPEGGAELLSTLRDGSRQHAVGVSSELREGLRLSVELIANEVLHRIRAAGVEPEQIMDPTDLGKELARESLRYLYRILFLLYTEARPELGVLPVTDDDYIQGYSLARLGEVASRKLIGESAEHGFHLYESLDLLFHMVNEGHNWLGMSAVDEITSEGAGLRFEPLKSDLFLPEKTHLIGRKAIVHPDFDEDDPDAQRIDTRLRNACLHQVLRWLMIARGKKKGRGGYISYAQLGINQLGAVYEGLMSYTGFIATEELYEVAKKGDPKDGSWMIPASKVGEYPDEVFVERTDEETGVRSRVCYDKGSFVYRLAGRDRQTSASYYTPQSLTEVTVQLALKYRLEEEGREVAARELLDWTICEPALGSGAFLNEAINQVAAEYLRRAQKERGETLDPERYAIELQKVKAYIALHNCYGVDLNRTAVELAEVSLWLNTMHSGLQAPWFGLHLRRGNSLIGAGRKTYTLAQLADKSWLKTAPAEHKLRDGDLPEGVIHHFLLPAEGWGAVAGNAEAKALAQDEAKRLGTWRRAMHKTPVARGRRSQVQRLLALSGRVEYLWKLVLRRLEISEREIRRNIAVWGAADLPPVPADPAHREKILKDLESTGTPYWRLKTVMDTWCALWHWPLDKATLLDGEAPEYGADTVTMTRVIEEPVYELAYAEQGMLDLGIDEQLTLPTPAKQVGSRARKQTVALRKLVPLANLDDWIAFAEAMLGRHDVPRDSLVIGFETLAEIEEYEDSLAGLMGMDDEGRLADRFPWLTVAMDIAEDEGFFHWALSFAHPFANGGFDIQVGNPPWVRPRWDESTVYAEHEPWFALEDRPVGVEKDRRRRELLDRARTWDYVLGELTVISAQSAFLGSRQAYPLLVGTHPDLYRAFMCQAWMHSSPSGTVGLLHPSTHFTGEKEGPLREAACRRLRIHGDFVNSGQRFFPPPVGHAAHFGVHVYGRERDIGFDHLSWLVSADALRYSADHDGSGEIPGIRYRNGEFDGRPHRTRVITVNNDVLTVWRRLLNDEDRPIARARLLFPVSTAEQIAIEALAAYPQRLATFNPQASLGLNESGAKKAKLIDYNRRDRVTGRDYQPAGWDEVILKGIQLGTATPIFKRHDANTNDPYGVDLVELPADFVPDTGYVQVPGRIEPYCAAYDQWIDHAAVGRLRADKEVVKWARARVAEVDRLPEPEVDAAKVDSLLAERCRRPYVDFYRLAWREMVAPDTERSLYAAIIPPGPTHVDAVNSLTMADARFTTLVAGFWASLPLDYFVRLTGRNHFRSAAANAMPAPDPQHPLASALLLRTLRLNCLTSAYSDLWTELFDPTWSDSESWACEWPGLQPLDDVSAQWGPDTPLRTERARRAALVEIDALVAAWLGMNADALIAAYRGRFPVLQKYEAVTWFDADGRKLAGNARTIGQRQSKESWKQFKAFLDNPKCSPAPEGYTMPFFKADREAEMRQAYAVFSQRLEDAINAGWTPS
ncbi:class I SAM-dependent DNA methyltransferase [Krasilnikovia sp. MM14-A1259]|uniref:class I SAM-dependent DNA methyltransferase n=1 Tax=Krasilnikovia sp. MM14-A1259 TaxID=3373539 RepID=UPI0038145467